MQPSMTDKSQQTRANYDKSQEHQQWRYGGNGRRPSSRQSCVPADGASRNTRQTNLVCTKHEKEKVKMQTTIEKLQEAFCDKESKLQDTKSQLVRERRMSEIMERQLKNARNLSEQLGRIINDREQEIRTLKNLLNKRQDTKNLSESAVQAAMLKASRQSDRRRSTSKDDFQASMRRSSSTSDHTECPSLSSQSVDKMLKEVHSLIDGLKIKDEAIKGLQEECTRRLDKIQILQRSVQVLQDQLAQSSQHHSSVLIEKDNEISQLQHSLKESEETVRSLLSEKTKVVIEGENTIQELQEIIQQKDLKIKRIQSQLEEALDTKETELQQLRDTLDNRQKELDTKQRDLEEANEELFRSQMEGEALKIELSQEKCSLSKMSEEINSLVEKLTTAVEEMEATKLEYQKKDERLKHTQNKIQEMYILFLGDQDITEKLQAVYKARRESTGRKVLSEEDVLETLLNPKNKNMFFRNENKGKHGSISLTNQQIHKQQLAELQQQVNDSQAVCSILQEQLKEVTDFLDQLLHIDISPKNLPALSLIKHYGKHLKTPSHSLSKERIAPDGVSSNSQLDMEFSRHGMMEVDQINQRNENEMAASNYELEVRHGSYEDLSYYDQQQFQFFAAHRSLSAENVRETNVHSVSMMEMQNSAKENSEPVPISVSVQGASSDSDEIILLLNDREVNKENTSSEATKHTKKLSRPAVVSPPFPRGLKITENYGSDGSINTRENSNNVIERSVSFGSFSDSVLMSYEQSERGASDESSGMVNNRCVRSIDMMDLIPVGNAEMKGVFLSSDSDIWSEPDTTLSRQRMGLNVEETSVSSDYSTTYVSDDLQKKKVCPQSRCESRRSKHVLHMPTKKTANKMKRWFEKLKNYLRMFEEANYHLTDEINNLCDVRNQMTAVLAAEEKIENPDAILYDLAEYIRLNFLMQKKLEKSIHFNRQLIDVFQRNISCQKKPHLDNISSVKQTPIKHPSRHKRHANKKSMEPAYMEDPNNIPNDRPYENPDIHSQLVGYHATLMSCQDMIKDLHAQLKDRHCNEIMNKHELNRTVYGYLEDIDHCIDDLCKKMETSTGESPSQSYSYKSAFSTNVTATDTPEEHVYETPEGFTHPLMDKLKENEDRLLRFEVLLNDKEQQLKLSAENALQLEEQLSSIKQSLYEIQIENMELKECLELSENKQLEMEDSSNQMLRELQVTMQRLADLEERFRCLNDKQYIQKDMDKPMYPVQYPYHNGDTWEEGNSTANIPVRERGSSNYSRDWESEDY
ncbi:golgin subfamily A member 4-like isoform X2 [Argiope bruennichi]|nr:golgin subfamily A member 4-like isoform X2 [Argiope bruennichi]